MEAIESAKRFAPYALNVFPGASIYLFGSYAKGCANENSDIDIAVIMDDVPSGMSPMEFLQKRGSLSFTATDLDERIELTFRPWSDPSGFVDSITDYGIKIA